jgi:hypothetical protein
MRRVSILVAVTAVVASGLMIGSSARATVTTLNFVMQQSQEVPPTGSTAVGKGTLKVDDVANTLTYVVDENVTNETAAHIHGPAARGVNAGVLFPLATTPHKTGTVSLTAAQVADALAGKYYVNAHSTAFPGGEIRGQADNQNSVPTLSQWGMIVLALALLLTGGWYAFRRRRALA